MAFDSCNSAPLTFLQSEILQPPRPALSNTPDLFTDDEQRRRTRAQLQRLDKEAASNSSVHAQHLQHIRSLLNNANLTTYDFKLPANLGPPREPRRDQANGTSTRTPKLSPFARLAMESADVSFRYPTPGTTPPPVMSEHATSNRRVSTQQSGHLGSKSTPRAQSALRDQIVVSPPKSTKVLDRIEIPPLVSNGTPSGHRERQSSYTNTAPAVSTQQTPRTIDPRQIQAPNQWPNSTPNAQSVQRNHNVAVVIPAPSSQLTNLNSSQFSTPTRQAAAPPLSQQSTPSGPAVVISAIPSGSQRSDYRDFSTTEQATAVGQKRKRPENDVGGVEVRIDQRARTEEVARALEHTIADISRAETKAKNGESVDTSFYFAQTAYNEEDTVVLTHQIQEKIESGIARAVEASALGRVQVTSLIKVQKLCESTLSLIEALGLSIDSQASSGDVEEWLQRVRLTENSLHSARILLRVLTAGREDKELYSEGILQTIAECLDLVMNRAIIPIVECRNSGQEEGLFKIYAANKKSLASLFNMFGQTLRLLNDLVAKVDVEAVVYKIQDLSTKLIFVENGANDRDSALGTARFEKLRARAMHVVASIFHRYPAQRQVIFNEIIASLEKVPIARQSARQYKLPDGDAIQLVSALLMRLVQTSATRSTSSRKHSDSAPRTADDSSEDDDVSVQGSSPAKAMHEGDMEVDDEIEPDEAEFDLRKLADPLYNSALKDATYLIQYLVGRAQNTTKSGDQPHRKLLDIFVDDFITVLGRPMWPGAEMLLRALLSKLYQMLKDDKSSVPAKNMALEILGTLGGGIINLRLSIELACRAADNAESSLTAKLAGIATDFLENGDNQGVNKFRGPYRVMMEYLHSQSLNEVQAPSARGLLLTGWAKTTLWYLSQDRDDVPAVNKDLPMQLRNMIIDADWLQNTYDAIDTSITPAQARFAAQIITMASPIGQHLAEIIDKLVHFMASSQSNLKSRSLKSVTELIEKDPAILERNRSVLTSIVKGMQDSSSQVRDSALMLLDKCLLLRPKIAADGLVYSRIIILAADDSKSVRKHAMKILKEIYLRCHDQGLQAHISAALMARINDLEPNVAEMAQQTFEELWMVPFYKTSRKDPAQREVDLKSQVSLIVKTVQRGEEAVEVLETLLSNVLSSESKSLTANLEVCKDMVRLMFDEIIDNEQQQDRPSQQHLAQALTVFSKAEPTLFSSDQLKLLVPYLPNLETSDQLTLYRHVTVIMRHVIPTLSSADKALLQDIQIKLVTEIRKLGKEELAEAAACAWTLHGILQNNRIVALMRSALDQVHKRKDLDFKDAKNEQAMKAVIKYMTIVGYFGRECNVDEHAESFRQLLPHWKGKSVSGLIVDEFYPFTRGKHPQALREAALDSIATVCQSWPQNYQRSDVSTAFDLVFRNEDRRFMQVVLSGFLLFFKQEERRSDTGAEIKVGEGAKKGTERLQKSFVAADHDVGATTIAQKFLPHILRVAVASTDELAVTATQVIASINRQGLVHPKECGPVLVVLETSTNKAIAELAFAEHKTQHLRQENVFDKEYMRAIQQTFEYQRDIIKDLRGVRLQPTTPKLQMLFDVLKLGSGKTRKRFLTNLVQRLNFELPELDFTGETPTAVLFARFVLENIGFFDYARLDELVHLVSCLEKLVVHGVGTNVAHAIEQEILKVQLPQARQGASMVVENGDEQPIDQPVPQEAPQDTPISAERLRHLTVASMILSMVWETRTHLRHMWGLAKQKKDGAKPQAKDLNKPATKTPFYRSELLEKIEAIMSALDDPMAQVAQCKAFAEIVAVDNEHKVASEEDEGDELARQAAGYETPDDERETASNAGSTGKGRKRKGSVGPSGTPSAKRTKNMANGATPKKRGRPKGSLNRQKSKSGSVDAESDY